MPRKTLELDLLVAFTNGLIRSNLSKEVKQGAYIVVEQAITKCGHSVIFDVEKNEHGIYRVYTLPKED